VGRPPWQRVQCTPRARRLFPTACGNHEDRKAQLPAKKDATLNPTAGGKIHAAQTRSRLPLGTKVWRRVTSPSPSGLDRDTVWTDAPRLVSGEYCQVQARWASSSGSCAPGPRTDQAPPRQAGPRKPAHSGAGGDKEINSSGVASPLDDDAALKAPP
jgi:hypothetical protein